MRLAAYAGASTVAAAGVILWAFNQRANFYSACVYLAQSNLCLMILTNLILLITCTFFYALQRLCYGPLRPIEVEQLYEKAWFAITETCLAMTIFREEVGAWFLVMFVALLAGKVWGWIGEGRVEILEQQPPANPRLFHARLSTSLALSLLYDASIMSYTINTVIQQARPNMMVMFLFEFAILTTSSFSTALRYVISLIETKITKQQTQERLAERRREIREAREEALRQREAAAAEGGDGNAQATVDLPPEEEVDEMDIEVSGWEAKGQWVLTLDLITDLFKLGIYSIFFCILLSFYGLPIHIMRDLFLTARSFVKRLTAFLRYRRATQDMNRRYPDATVEDIAREDTCIICREDMRPWSETNPPIPPRDGGAAPGPPRGGSPANERSRPKKLPCGHILHLGCLKSWLERQQVCPTCRRSVVTPVDNPRQPANRPNQQANGQGAAGQQEPHQPGAAPPPAAPRANRGMRMINFGPIRVGFGQANMQELAQQLQGQQQNPGARMYGFELGFPRNNNNNPQQQQQQQQEQPQAPNGLPAGPAAQAQAQLALIEQQIMQQIRTLQVTQQELHLVQLLQSELTRLRNLQAGVQPPGANVPGSTGVQQLFNQLGGTFPPLQPVPQQPVIQRHAVLPGTSSIPAGSADLPPGVAIPEGWSLLPLQRVEPPGANTLGAINVSRNISTNVSPPTVDTAQASTIPGAASAPPSDPSTGTLAANTPSEETPVPTTTNGTATQSESEGSTTQQENTVPNVQANPEASQAVDISSDSSPTPESTIAAAGPSNRDPTAPPATVQASSSTSSNPPITTVPETSQAERNNETEDENGNTQATEDGSQAKGKARAATVEDTVDEE